MSVWFASDLHLDPAAPGTAERFLAFLSGPVRQASALYLLGDLFEAWIGDDDPEPAHRRVIEAIAGVAAGGTLVYVMRGNRDFLIGSRFCSESGALLLDDPVRVTIGGQAVLLSHGDGFCVDDGSYQRLRSLVRDPGVRRGFERLSLADRRRLATEARAGSREHLAASAEYIADVNQSAVESVMQSAGVGMLIHGHTHRPGVHRFEAGGMARTRIVLGAWHDAATVLHWDETGWRLTQAAA